ncbi:predicted protein [Plenodomus lingam JN3]|uniref:Predicted protein n=1 Tax=Leptosphaeria maculans (strain JN3 / isolate v23.1.3 / race Av1-4-5-6-7-8) TaxID=985895 RepID=E4ZR57_LEPMJ|nr:predicted protein [Plenodomus lingam JN3]CBX93722.1 predicted protein [Plenodomus lingam JN3]
MPPITRLGTHSPPKTVSDNPSSNTVVPSVQSIPFSYSGTKSASSNERQDRQST